MEGTEEKDLHSQKQLQFKLYRDTYEQKLTRWSKQLCRVYQCSPCIYEDMVQAAYLHVYKCIDLWDPYKANLYTYTYLGVRKAFMNVIREYHSNKRTSSKPVMRYVTSEGDMIWPNPSHSLSIEENLSLRTIVAKELELDPKRMNRFLLYALDTKSVTDLAQESNTPISRQAYYNSIAYMRTRLRKKVSFYK